MAKRYLTPKKAIGQTRILYGTTHRIVVPYSATRTDKGYEFTLGKHRFLAPNHASIVIDIDKLPESWFINLNGEY